MLAPIVDALLELSIVGSFSRAGSSVRRRLFGWQPLPAAALDGRTVLVTGPTSGLGREMAGAFASLGARVVLVGRNQETLEAVAAALEREHGADRVTAVAADLASLDSVGNAVDQILAAEPRLDVVVDNAGAMFPSRRESPDGIEATLATMVVGPFALIAGLLPLLRRTASARVIAVTSGGMYVQPLRLDDLAWRRRAWNGPRAYAQAKRAQVVLVREWARRVPAAEVTFNAMHPGWADTPGLSASLPGFARLMGPLLRTPAEGVDTALWLAAVPDVAGLTGHLYLDRQPRPFDRAPHTRLTAADRVELWNEVVRLADIPDPTPTAQLEQPDDTHP
jgi:NAD(P)-dependent dehydrogenase (short-subunit alcohol dehydrogenase family)